MKKIYQYVAFVVLGLMVSNSLIFSADLLVAAKAESPTRVENHQSTVAEALPLSDQEMSETKGAFWPYVIGAGVGAVGGAVGYSGYVVVSNNPWSWREFTGATVGGAIGGVMNPVASIPTAVRSVTTGLASGIGAGIIVRR